MQIRQILDTAVTRLTPTSDTPRLDCELLLTHVLGKDRIYLMTWPEHELSLPQQHAFEALLEQRQTGVPIAYLLQQAEFWSLKLKVTTETLIPRPETELLVEQALELIPHDSQWHIADLGTGSGAIAIALASERPLCRFLAVDINPDTLAVARDNARLYQLENIEFACGSWLQPIAGSYQMIVSNPPYIAPDDPHLQQGDVRYEPQRALVASQQGLADIETIIQNARPHLTGPGILILEHGYQQAESVRKLLIENGYQQVESHLDLQGHPRITLGCYSVA
jgi:release factor glutamine methyltransferase